MRAWVPARARVRAPVHVCLHRVGQRGIACWGYRGCSVGVMNRMLLCSVSQLSARLAEEERKVREGRGGEGGEGDRQITGGG